MARILLLGGTGAIGVYLRQQLAERGDIVFVTTRRDRHDEEHIQFIRGDAHDDAFLQSAIKTTHPDAIVDFMIYGTEEFRSRRDALVSASGQYVFLSSYRVFAEEVPLTEKSPRLLDVSHDKEYLATDEYALRKAREEDILRNGQGRNWTSVRPAITYSKERFQFGCLEAGAICWRALHGLPNIIPEEMMEKRTTMTWGFDVARMIAGLVLNDSAIGEDFNCATAEHHSWREVADIYRRHIGMKVKSCSMDEYLALSNWRYQVLYDRMFDRVLDNSKVLSATHIAPNTLTTLEDGLGRELDTFARHNSKPSPDLLKNARIDHITGTSLLTFRHLSRQEKKKYVKLRWPTLMDSTVLRILQRITRFLYT